MKRGRADSEPPLLAAPSASALESRFQLFGVGEPHPMDIEGGAADCSCERCGRWSRFVRGEEPGGWTQYEVLTAELVRGLAAFLRGIAASEADAAAPLRVLEVGAGDGRLSHHLAEALAGAAVTLVATDSFARNLRTAAPVARLDYRAALAAHAPHVVLACWMPLGDDWTAAFRAAPSVQRYVLIGEVDDGCCGHPWRTWGYLPPGGRGDASCSVSSTSSPSSEGVDSDDGGSSGDGAEGDGGGGGDDDGGDGGASPAGAGDAWRRVYQASPELTPWGADGWRRHELCEVSARQVCRTDAPWCATRHSHTTVFSRDRPPGGEAEG